MLQPGTGCKFPRPISDPTAKEGMRLNGRTSSSGVCSPSRYHAFSPRRYHGGLDCRVDICGSFGRALIQSERMTLPRWQTAWDNRRPASGKWHLALGFGRSLPDKTKFFSHHRYGGKRGTFQAAPMNIVRRGETFFRTDSGGATM